MNIFGQSVCHLLIQELIHVCHVSRNPVVMVSPAVRVVGNGVLSPRVASFSSTDPSLLFPGILKVYIIINLRQIVECLSLFVCYLAYLVFQN